MPFKFNKINLVYTYIKLTQVKKQLATLKRRIFHYDIIYQMSYLLSLIFSRITNKENYQVCNAETVKSGYLGFLTHHFGTLDNTHLRMENSEMNVWKIYSKLQITLNWTHMPRVYGQSSIWHLSRVQSTNAGENYFSSLRHQAT